MRDEEYLKNQIEIEQMKNSVSSTSFNTLIVIIGILLAVIIIIGVITMFIK